MSLVVRQSPGPALLVWVRGNILPYMPAETLEELLVWVHQPTSTRISSQARSTPLRARRCRCGVVWVTKGHPPQLVGIVVVVVVVVVVDGMWGRVGDHRSPSTARVVGSSSGKCLPKKKHRASIRCGRRARNRLQRQRGGRLLVVVLSPTQLPIGYSVRPCATALLRYCATALLRYCATALLCTALLRYCATALSYFIVIVASAVSSFSAQWSSSLPRQCLCFLVVNARRRRSTRAFVLRRSHCILRIYSVLIMVFISRYSVLLLLFSLPCSARCGY